MIGRELGKLHKADVIHGDLTTSNMMLRKRTKLGVQGSGSELVSDFSSVLLSQSPIYHCKF